VTLPATIEVHSDRQAWLAAKASGIGSSEAPVIMGYGYEESAVELWLRKTGKAPPKEASRRMRVGKALEAEIHLEAEEDLGTTLVNPGEFTILRSVAEPWRLATIDRFVTDPEKLLRAERRYDSAAKALGYLLRIGAILGPAELKSVALYAADEWETEPPDYPLLQVQHQLAVSGLGRGWVCALFGLSDDFRIYEVPAHERLQAMLHEYETAFWDCVQRDVPPAPDGSASASKALSQIYQHERATEIVLPAEYNELHTELKALKADAAANEDRRKHIENTLKAAMGESVRARILGGGRYQWKSKTVREHIVHEHTYREFREIKE